MNQKDLKDIGTATTDKDDYGLNSQENLNDDISVIEAESFLKQYAQNYSVKFESSSSGTKKSDQTEDNNLIKLVKIIRHELILSPLITGYIHSSENVIENFFIKYSETSIRLIQDAVAKYFDQPKVLIVLIRAIANNWSNIKLKNSAIIMCIACLGHADMEVREEALNAFNLLDDLDVIKYLENSRNETVDFLKNYKLEIIEDKKNYYGISKKIHSS
jgi:hypothetical protein